MDEQDRESLETGAGDAAVSESSAFAAIAPDGRSGEAARVPYAPVGGDLGADAGADEGGAGGAGVGGSGAFGAGERDGGAGQDFAGPAADAQSLGRRAVELLDEAPAIVARAVAKKRRKKAAKAAAARPKAPRTEAQIAAARANMEKARAAREANQANQAAAQSAAGAFVVHPADAAGQRPAAFFTLGKGKSRAERKAEREQTQQANTDGKAPHALSAFEAENFREKLFEILVSLWELADKGLSATALDGAECDIW